MSHIEEKPIHIYLKRKKKHFSWQRFSSNQNEAPFLFLVSTALGGKRSESTPMPSDVLQCKKKRHKEKESHFLVESSRPTWRPVTQCNGTDDRIRRRNFHVTRADWLRIDWPTVRCVALRFVSFSLSPARIARPDEPTKKTTINGQSGGPFLSTRCHVPRKTQ